MPPPLAAASDATADRCFTLRHRPDELRILVTSFIDGLRFSAAYGPLHRAKALRWLAYPLLLPAAVMGEGEGAEDEELPEPWACSDALRQAAALCCELARGGGAVTSAAAHHLLTAVLPPGEGGRRCMGRHMTLLRCW